MSLPERAANHDQPAGVELPVLVRSQMLDRSLRHAPSSRRRVLVVDDNVDASRSLAKLLELSGYEVRVAHNGPAALEAAQTCRPEVVLLDIGLPRMDGYEVARRLREQPATEHALLVALTGYGQEEDRRRSREAGFDHYLVKPVDPQAVQELLALRAEAKPHAVPSPAADLP